MAGNAETHSPEHGLQVAQRYVEQVKAQFLFLTQDVVSSSFSSQTSDAILELD
jgi:hypothetical protein